MADAVTIGAAPAGQPGAVSVSGQGPAVSGQQVSGQSSPTTGQQEQSQPQVNYVTSEQLNDAIGRIERLVQSSTDKSYNRVQKMISQLQQAGIQNVTEQQARAMLAAQGESEQQGQEPEAQPVQSAAASPEAEAWIRSAGGDITQGYWNDIYDAAQEAGVGIIAREDPEYAQFFTDENGQPKQFQKTRHFVRAFENAFEAKRQRLAEQGAGGQQGMAGGNLASSPALAGGGAKSNFHDPKKTDRSDLIMAGLREQRRR